MADTINYERYSILSQKFFKLKAPNVGTNSGFGSNPPLGPP